MRHAPNTNVLKASPGWSNDDGVLCVVCPDCAFTFDAAHVTQATGRYDCPVCAADQLEAALEELAKGSPHKIKGEFVTAADFAAAALAHDTERGEEA